MTTMLWKSEYYWYIAEYFLEKSGSLWFMLYVGIHSPYPDHNILFLVSGQLFVKLICDDSYRIPFFSRLSQSLFRLFESETEFQCTTLRSHYCTSLCDPLFRHVSNIEVIHKAVEESQVCHLFAGTRVICVHAARSSLAAIAIITERYGGSFGWVFSAAGWNIVLGWWMRTRLLIAHNRVHLAFQWWRRRWWSFNFASSYLVYAIYSIKVQSTGV